MTRTPMTLRGAERLRTELKQLKSEARPNVIKAIAEARARGLTGPTDPDQHTGDALQAELLPHRESEPVDVADVHDVVESARDRARKQGEDDHKPRPGTINREPGDEDDEAQIKLLPLRR